MTTTVLRDYRPDDLERVHAINQAEVPAVGDATPEALAHIAAESVISLVAEVDGDVGGFCLVLGPGADYGSMNYRWFAERYDDFVYVDRVVVAAHGRGAGVGSVLYREFARRGRERGAPVMLAEVNLRPANPGSLRFHDRHGFVPVGEQDTEEGTKRVSLLERRLRHD